MESLNRDGLKPSGSRVVERTFYSDRLSPRKIISICYFLIMVLSNGFEVRDFEGIDTAAPDEKTKKKDGKKYIKLLPY